ncbi:MAG TPA: Xaa-Pro peptidase family protein [Isosphaeraceae bacterium]|jgi:Xaa-Pro aminopeptidase|nr:Xaa-Pro peptidase family protein [Isosphaeraceae bacterium]
MLTAQGCASRRKRLWDALPAPCDVLIVGDPSNLIYLANYAQSAFTFRSNDAGALLLLQHDHATLVADSMVQPYLEAAHVDRLHAPTWYDGLRSAPRRQTLLVQSTLEALASMPGKQVGIEASSVPIGVIEGLRSARPGLELIDIDPTLRRLRRAKDADELEILKKSIAAGEAGFAAALEAIQPGMTEFEAFLLVQKASLEAIGDKAILYGDFDSGPRGHKVIGPPSERTILAGDLFILDFSVVLNGYRGDFANTILAGGKPTPRQQELYEGCIAAMEAGEAMLRPGTPARDVDAAVRQEFARRGLDPHFPSHCGHGIGLGHPEPPYIVPESDDTLLPGDVVTLEPGQYAPDYGGMRYERNYLITASGFETLTHHRLALVP